MTSTQEIVARDAVISGCGRYRYELRRRWDASLPLATFVMLNPSVADARQDDPTIRRCMDFARRWGCGGICVVNLYAYRATIPEDLALVAKEGGDPVGFQNDAWLVRAASQAARTGASLVAAWGAKHADPQRVRWVLRLLGMRRLTCLGTTKDGSPRHPLYVRADTALLPWQPPG